MKQQKRLERLEKYLVALVEDRNGDASTRDFGTRVLLGFLKGLSRIYFVVIQLRLLLYRNGIFRHYTLGCQVISVGNLTVGGTGKTPVVEVFARELQKEGRKVAILSRGYKKVEPSFLKKIADKITLREARRPPRVVSNGKEGTNRSVGWLPNSRQM